MSYLDTIVVKVHDGGRISNRAAPLAIDVDMDGITHVLGIGVQADEGATFGAAVCAKLANRDVRDVLIVCGDHLTGFPRSTRGDLATVQTCMVHLIRAAMQFVSYGNRTTAALKPIYQAANAKTALTEPATYGGDRTRQTLPLDQQDIP